MGVLTKDFKVISVAASGTESVPECAAVSIRNTADEGTVTVTNTNTGSSFTLTTKQSVDLSWDFNIGAMSVACDSDATAEVIYWL